MRMDPYHITFSQYATGSIVDESTIFLNSYEYPDTENGFKPPNPSLDLNFMNVSFDSSDSGSNDLGLSFALSSSEESFQLSPGWSHEEDSSSPSNDSDSSDPVLKYISQMLMEENMEDKPPMFYDSVALKATEKSLYDVLGEQDHLHHVNYESPASNHSGNGSDYSGNEFADPQLVLDVRELNPVPNDHQLPTNVQPASQFLANSSNGLPDIGNGIVGSSTSKMVQNMFSDSDSVLQFKRGVEEASKFLPRASQLIVDLETSSFADRQKEEKAERPSSTNRSRGRKNYSREDLDSERGRSSKQSALYVEETEISDAFDNVLLWPGMKGTEWCCVPSKTLQANELSNGSNGGKIRAKKQGKKKETVDLRSLLILCAQSVSGNDFRTANELLKQIRQHSSPSGDGSQRLAHCFANGLEARMAGSAAGMQTFVSSITAKKMTAADILNAYKTHLNACPFKKLSIVFANKMIMRAAEKATTLHIVDFGVLYGFQWPILIQLLSMRDGGPPKLRITGIELPQHGFRPAERIEETGRRLARYCNRFGVPFEYNPIAAQNWESIRIEDLKISSNEVLAVNCLARFKNLLDETVEVDCPRNAVLGLIRKIKPNIFVQSIINGSYNAPFFVTRFREAVFHFSSLFDMFDSTTPRDDQGRRMLENEVYGREAMNVVACEGTERVERPETYKQWQVRMTRAGFKQLPLDQEVIQTCRDKLKCYHRDFVVDEDNNWMLQGWKGRIMYASSCWLPV